MKNTLIICLFLFVTKLYSQNLEGTWKGVSTTPYSQSSIELKITNLGDGVYNIYGVEHCKDGDIEFRVKMRYNFNLGSGKLYRKDFSINCNFCEGNPEEESNAICDDNFTITYFKESCHMLYFDCADNKVSWQVGQKIKKIKKKIISDIPKA